MLDEKIKEGIKNICSSYENIEKVILFGSRAMDKEKYNSDIDLAVIGKFDLLFCERLKEELSELPTLLKFDVISYNDIENQELINDIKNHGKIIYKK